MYYAKFKADLAKAEEIKDFYHAEEIKDPNKPYEFFSVNVDGVHIQAYKNKKEVFTIVFSSPKEIAVEEAKQFSENVSVNHTDDSVGIKDNKDVYFDQWEDLHAQIGSDEVGVGDFFGPLIVVASYVDENDIQFLEKYKINDSKKMKDNYIMEIGPILKRRIKNYVVMVSPKKLSDLASNHFNIHKVMAKCHNLAQQKLMEKYNLSKNLIVYVDQFTPENDYRKLVGDEIISSTLYFRTKGESYFPSVAAASVIARYTFLKQWELMEADLSMTIPKGASALVDRCYHQLKASEKAGIVDNYIKKFFSNYSKE